MDDRTGDVRPVARAIGHLGQNSDIARTSGQNN